MVVVSPILKKKKKTQQRRKKEIKIADVFHFFFFGFFCFYEEGCVFLAFVIRIAELKDSVFNVFHDLLDEDWFYNTKIDLHFCMSKD